MSILLGLGVVRKYYKEIEIPGFIGKLVIPYRFQEVDRRRLRIEREDKDRNSLLWTIWSPIQDEYIYLQDRSKCDIQPILGAGVQDYIWYWNKHEEEYPYGYGLGDVLFRTAYLKLKAIEYYADAIEAWKEPFIFAFTDAAKGVINAEIGAGFDKKVDRLKEIAEVLEKTKSSHRAVFDKNDKIEFKELGSVGTNMLASFIDWCENKQKKLILGAELTTEVGKTGSYGQATTHERQTMGIVKYHRCRLAQVFKKQFIMDIVQRNVRFFIQNFGYLPTKQAIQSIKITSDIEEAKEKAVEANLSDYRGNMENVVGV